MRRVASLLLWLLLWPGLALAQPALDGHNTGTSSSGTTVAFTATTVSANEILIASAAVRASGTTTNPNLTIAGCGLTWNQVGTQSQFNNAVPEGTATYTWSAKASGTLSACTITVTSSQTIKSASAAYCSFSGANFSSPFDPHASVPASSTNSTNTNVAGTVTMSSNLAHDTYVSTWGQVSANEGGLTANTGATLCANVTNSGGLNFSNMYISYRQFTTTQTGIAIGVNASTPYWGMNGTVLTADSVATAAKVLFRGFP